MSRLNSSRPPVYTHEGGTARRITPEQQLRRSVMACMLWEKTFYEDGVEIVKRIEDTITKIKPNIVSSIAKEARGKMHIRHAPLLIARIMARLQTHKPWVSDLLEYIIQRPDELTEFIAIYLKNNKNAPLSAQVKKGLAKAMRKFDKYQLAKWNKPDAQIKLRNVLLLCHPKPKDRIQSRNWKDLLENRLSPPDTWEVAISACGKDDDKKRREFIRLITTGKIGGMAMIKNLRKMQEVKVPDTVIIEGIQNIKAKNILPYRFITAARYAQHLEPYLEDVMLNRINRDKRLTGHTVFLIDVSGSMYDPLSYRKDKRTGRMIPSEMKRIDAACGLAILIREICERVDMFTFSTKLIRIAPRRGFALRDTILTSQRHGRTYLGTSIKAIYSNTAIEDRGYIHPLYLHGKPSVNFPGYNMRPDRLIVITDEQSHDRVRDPIGRGYMINVGVNKNGVGYGKWLHIDGFSESVVNYISEYESYIDR